MSKPRTAAELLDTLRDSILREIAEIPIRDSLQDSLLARAMEKSEIEALKSFRTSRSFPESLAAAHRAFQLELVHSHALPIDGSSLTTMTPLVDDGRFE